MTMKNYRVDYADGSHQFFQADDSTDEGKAWLEAHEDAVKSDESPVEKVAAAKNVPSGGGLESNVDVQKDSA